jgi:hypothetical protein
MNGSAGAPSPVTSSWPLVAGSASVPVPSVPSVYSEDSGASKLPNGS